MFTAGRQALFLLSNRDEMNESDHWHRGEIQAGAVNGVSHRTRRQGLKHRPSIFDNWFESCGLTHFRSWLIGQGNDGVNAFAPEPLVNGLTRLYRS